MTGNESGKLESSVRGILDAKGGDVFTTAQETLVSDAVREMNENGVGSLLVVSGDRPVGIFTERDVLKKLVGEGLDPHETPVSRVMSTNLIVVSPGTSIGEAMAVVTLKRCRHLPVMERGKLVGLVSSGDLTNWLTKAQEIHIKDLTDYILGNYPN